MTLYTDTNPRRRHPQTLAALSGALDWPAEYLSNVLHGEKTLVPSAGTDDRLLKVVISIERELHDLRQRVTAIERRLAGDDA